MQHTQKHKPQAESKVPSLDSFHQAQRILKRFNDAAIEGPMPWTLEDPTPTMLYRTITASSHTGALHLLGTAVKMVAPNATLMTNTDDETVITIPAEAGDKTTFPTHQLERALDTIRDDLPNAITQREDGSSILETEKLKYLSPDDGIHLIAQLYRANRNFYPLKANTILANNWQLPQNTRFLNEQGELENNVDHKTYQRVMAHRATVDGAAMTEVLPQHGGKYITMDKASYTALLTELGMAGCSKDMPLH